MINLRADIQDYIACNSLSGKLLRIFTPVNLRLLGERTAADIELVFLPKSGAENCLKGAPADTHQLALVVWKRAPVRL